MVDESAVGVTGRSADRAASARHVRDAGADATLRWPVGPGSAEATDQGAGLRLYGDRRGPTAHSRGRAGAAGPVGRAVPRRGAARLGEPVGALWSRLTDRDRRILHLVSDHRVLTTDQLTVLEFGSLSRAQHRLQELHSLDVLWRFRFPGRPVVRIRGTTPSATPEPG
jgi:hypothetical protein